MSLVVREPSSLVEVDDQCAAVETWATGCENVAALRDASNKLAAIDEYLARTSTEGRARVAAAMRRLEVRIGQLLGPAERGNPNFRHDGNSADEPVSRHQRQEFRQMAEHPEVVEQVIAESTDEKPASRRSVMQRLADAAKEHPVTPPRNLPRPERVEQITALASKGNTSHQIAKQIGVDAHYVRRLSREEGIALADDVLGKTRLHDSTRILDETVTTLEAVAMSLTVVEIDQLDLDQVERWVASLTDSLRSLNRFTKQLKETTRGTE